MHSTSYSVTFKYRPCAESMSPCCMGFQYSSRLGASCDIGRDL